MVPLLSVSSRRTRLSTKGEGHGRLQRCISFDTSRTIIGTLYKLRKVIWNKRCFFFTFNWGRPFLASFSRACKTYSFCKPHPSPQKRADKNTPTKWRFCLSNIVIFKFWKKCTSAVDPLPPAYVLYARDNDEKNGRPLRNWYHKTYWNWDFCTNYVLKKS